jgi:2-iminoacetate synthase
MEENQSPIESGAVKDATASTDAAEWTHGNEAPHYDMKSERAVDFINDEEIRETIRYAEENKANVTLIDSLIKKAAEGKGLPHREAAVLLACELPDKVQEMMDTAKAIKERFYGNRIVLFAPLYLSNYCINGCLYCPYHAKNKHIPRVKLTQDQVRAETIALQDMGHKRLALECGEDPVNNPLDYVLECIDTIYTTKHRDGAIRRVNVNIAATTTANFKRLHDAKIGTYILFQETYDKAGYEKLHPTGPKHSYARQTEAFDRAMRAGCEDCGLGVLFGLENYLYEYIGLLMHAEHLEAVFGCGPHTISVPRVKPADDIDPNSFDGKFADDLFVKIVAAIRLAVPYTGMIMSTREGEEVRRRSLECGISQVSGASRTSVGGYVTPERHNESAQFDVSDQRSLDEVVCWLMELGYVPSFCTACYRSNRVGGKFMKLLKGGHISVNCQSNALMTLNEFLNDYASPETKTIGSKLIATEIEKIDDVKKREYVRETVKAGAHDHYV